MKRTTATVPLKTSWRAPTLGEPRPGLADSLRTPQGTLQRYVNVFVGSDNIKSLGGLGTLVPSGVEVWVIPPGGGG